MKMCTGCLLALPFTEFHKNHTAKDGHRHRCKACTKAENSKWRADNKEQMAGIMADWYRRNKGAANRKQQCWHYRKHYGITLDQFEQMLVDQDSKCALCQTELTRGVYKGPAKAVLDHCHVTGEIRGILCSHCNQGLGLFKDSAAILRQAAFYLENYNSYPIARHRARTAPSDGVGPVQTEHQSQPAT